MKNISIAILLLVVLGCKGQIKTKQLKDVKAIPMERFDKNLFNEKQVNGHYDYSFPDGTQVQQWETPPEHYVETRIKPNSPFEVYREFYYDSGLLKKHGELFFNFPIGVWKEYDESGKLIHEINEDSLYIFSILELDKKMKKEGISIMIKTPEVSVNRLIEDNKPIYTVYFPVSSQNPYLLYELTVDGKSGETIEKTTIQVRK